MSPSQLDEIFDLLEQLRVAAGDFTKKPATTKSRPTSGRLRNRLGHPGQAAVTGDEDLPQPRGSAGTATPCIVVVMPTKLNPPAGASRRTVEPARCQARWSSGPAE